MAADDSHPSAADIGAHYERHAAAWDADRGKHLFERTWLERFTALVPPGGNVLDLGCGSGEPIARYLIGAGYGVMGIDAAPSLVALAQARFPDQVWLVGDMRTIELGRTFDGILAWDSFFHLPRCDQRAMFPRFAAHAAPGAALMFTSGPHDGEVVGSYRSDPLFHASLAPEAYRTLLSEAGFEVVAHIAEDPACEGRTVWLARRAGG